jgi:hypothetical protein
MWVRTGPRPDLTVDFRTETRHLEVVTLEMGPVEYLLLGFPGNEFKGDIAPALGRLIGNGTVRVIDLVFISKGPDGDVATFEFDQLESLAPFAALEGEAGGLVGPEDIAHAAAALEPNSSAALIVWEDTWATELAKAVREANGVILEGARIPHEVVQEALAELAAAG